eukprot:6186350-Pleurochrysis_carterae.AAC.3
MEVEAVAVIRTAGLGIATRGCYSHAAARIGRGQPAGVALVPAFETRADSAWHKKEARRHWMVEQHERREGDRGRQRES